MILSNGKGNLVFYYWAKKAGNLTIAVGKYLALTKKKMSMFQRTRKKEGFFHNIGTLYDDREFQQFLYLHNSHSSLGDSAYSGRWEGIN